MTNACTKGLRLYRPILYGEQKGNTKKVVVQDNQQNSQVENLYKQLSTMEDTIKNMNKEHKELKEISINEAV